MNLHRLAEERSIELHRAVAARLRQEPELIEAARRRVEERREKGLLNPAYAERWQRVLSYELPALLEFLVDQGEEARELRQVTPFAGLVPPRERWRIWREVKRRELPHG